MSKSAGACAQSAHSNQHIPIQLGVSILTLDSEHQQVFSSWISCVCTCSDFQAPFEFREETFRRVGYLVGPHLLVAEL